MVDVFADTFFTIRPEDDLHQLVCGVKMLQEHL